MNTNIFRCRICGRYAIFEELDLHECRSLKDYEFEEDIIRVFDGKEWYPLNLKKVLRNRVERKYHKRLAGTKSNRKFTDDRDTEKFTECGFRFCQVNSSLVEFFSVSSVGSSQFLCSKSFSIYLISSIVFFRGIFTPTFFSRESLLSIRSFL